jgi:protein-disulfide isomerase
VSNRTIHNKTRNLFTFARPFALAIAGALIAASCAQVEVTEDVSEAAVAAEAVERYAGIQQHDGVLGDEHAPVTLMVFSDLRCSHCRNFGQKVLPVLVERYVRTGKLRVVHQNLPILGAPSVAAARMADAVGEQGHMFEFMDVFFATAPRDVNEDLLRRLASSVPGVNADAALADRDASAITEKLVETRVLADHYQVQGTPTFLLGKTGGDLTRLRAHPAIADTITGPIDTLLANR